jgi:hypothetical protein
MCSYTVCAGLAAPSQRGSITPSSPPYRPPEGVDKRIDVVATLIQKRGTVFDLEEAELCYGGVWGL